MVEVHFDDVEVGEDHLATFTDEVGNLISDLENLQYITDVLTNHGFAVDVVVDEHGDISPTITNRGDD